MGWRSPFLIAIISCSSEQGKPLTAHTFAAAKRDSASSMKKVKREDEEEELDRKKPYIFQLPDHITVEIFCKIPTKTLIQCRCVCKSWRRSLSSDPQFTRDLFSRTPTCLLVQDFSPGLNSTRLYMIDLDLIDLDKGSKRNGVLMELPGDPNAPYGVQIVGSCNGFLCLSGFYNDTHRFRISNPITGESLALPPLPTKQKCLFLAGFGFSPISDVYKVVMVTFQTKECNEGEVMVMTVGSGIWRNIGDFVYSFGDIHSRFSSFGIFVSGFLHWIGQCSKGSLLLCAFDIESERFQQLPLPPFSSKFMLGVFKGWLSITVGSSNSNIDVWVMKDYGVNGSWTKELEIVDAIGSQVLMLTEKEQVLLSLWFEFLAYNPGRRNSVWLPVDGLPFYFLAFAHTPTFVPLKDIIKGRA